MTDNDTTTNETACRTCGQLEGIAEYDATLWDLYYRIDDGRGNRRGLSFTADDMAEWGPDDDEAHEVLTATMERDMHSRGLCVTCGRPDLRGVDPSRIMSADDADAMAEMYAEQRAEQLAGC